MASTGELEQAGNADYQNEHMAQLFEEGLSFSGFERDGLFWSRDDGTYLEISGVSGLDSITDGRGLAFGDLDNDGDLDVTIVPVQEVGRLLFRNNVGRDNAYLRVSLRGTRSAPDAFGAVLRLETPAGTQTKIKAGGSGFLSFHDPRILFGLGPEPKESYRLEITWPSGLVETHDVRPGESIDVVEAESVTRVAEPTAQLPGPLTTSERILRNLALRSGQRLPELALTPIGSLSAPALGSTGRRTLVNIWATWCIPCAVEMPELQRLYPLLNAAGIDLIGISVDTSTEKVPAYLEDKSVGYPNYVLAEEDFPKIFSGDALTVPLTLLLDEAGAVIEAFSGWSADTRARIEALVETETEP